MQEKKSSFAALLPIAIFLVIYIGGGILFQDFYAMPAIVVFLIALAVAFLQNRGLKFNEKMHLIAEELSDDNIITMCLIFLLAGAFTGAATAAGGVDSTVNLGLTLLPGGLAVVGLFVIGCFISTSMGTSVGTISALAPIAVGISEKTGFAMALCLGAVVSGAMFGDNLSMISDTTIAATKTQGCEMKDKFRTNFLIVLPAAIINIVILLVITMNANYAVSGDLSYNFLQVVPYLVVLIGALIGFNVFAVLGVGTILSIAVGLYTGTIPVNEIFTSMGTGVTNMYDITVISIVVCAISALMKAGGGIQAILDLIRRRVKSRPRRHAGHWRPVRRCGRGHRQQHHLHRYDRRIGARHQPGIRHRPQADRLPAGHLYLRGTGSAPLRGAAALRLRRHQGAGVLLRHRALLLLSHAHGRVRSGVYPVQQKDKITVPLTKSAFP